MTVLHICSSVSRAVGGPARSVQGLVAAQRAAGIDAWLMTLKDLGDPWVPGIENYRCAKCPGARGVRAAVEKVLDECRPDLVEVHCMWLLNLHRAIAAVRARGIPYVVTPRGSVDDWSLRQKAWRKRLALLTYQGRDLRHAVAFHTTSDAETEQIRRLGYRQPVIQAPNGVNVPETLPPWRREGPVRRMLFLSRMHEKKGVRELVEAWDSVRPKGWICELVYSVCGATEAAYEREVRGLVSVRGLDGQFVFSGAVADEDKWRVYRRADCFVLPTHTENFGIAVAEALYAGLPVITTTGAPWRAVAERRCGWWVAADDVGALADALRAATDLPDGELRRMGERGHGLATETCLWAAIAKTMKGEYERVLAWRR